MILRMKITSNLVFMILSRFLTEGGKRGDQTANDSRTLATRRKCLEPLENHGKQRSFVAAQPVEV